MIESAGWIYRAASEAYDRREAIGSAWKSIRSLLTEKKRTIAFTGMSGAGKSALLDFLGEKPPPSPRPLSSGPEDGSLPASKRKRIVVVPGQHSAIRYRTLDKLFLGRAPVDVLVHTISDGLITLRDDTAKSLHIERGLASLSAYREHMREQELEDLKLTCSYVRKAHHKHRKPHILLVALTKIDLYFSVYNGKERAEAEGKYSPNAASAFTDVLNNLQGVLGTDFFHWEILPVSTFLTPFHWSGPARSPQLSHEQRDRLVAKFAAKLSDLCR